MYMEQTHILALSFMCPKIYVRLTFYFFFSGGASEKLPIFLSVLPKSKPHYAVVVEYYILPGSI